MNRRRFLAVAGTTIMGGVAGCVRHLPVDKGVQNGKEGAVIHVQPDGSFFNSGGEDEPLGSIHRAVNVADPGDTVYVHPGEYVEEVEADVGGDSENPVTLTGPEDAVLKPPEGYEGPALAIDKSYFHLTGLTITGLYDPDAPKDPASYHRDKLISINSDADGPDDYLEGLVVSPHALGGAGQALINSVQFKDSSVGGFKVIGPAGTKWIFDDDEGHNGEVVYLGTAPDNRLDRGYDTYDRTRNIRVHHIDNSEGHLHSELVDCKAGVENVTIEYCTDGGGAKSNDSYYTRSISMDGMSCTVRWNIFRDIHGYGVRIGPQSYISDINFVDSEPQTEYDRRLGTNHAIYGNVFAGCTSDAIDFLRESMRPGRATNPLPEDQRVFCGNLYDGHSDGHSAAENCGDGPTSEGIGHLGGASPWEGIPPKKEDLFEEIATAQHLKVTVHTTTVSPGPFEIPVTVANNSDTADDVTLGLRTGEHLLTETTVQVPAGGARDATLTENLDQTIELGIMRNGQKVGSVQITDSE